MGGGEGYAFLLEPFLRQGAAYARSILRNRHDAEDAVQQAALRGLERFESYDATRPFRGWWFAILRNCCIDRLRARKVEAAGSPTVHDMPDGTTPGASGWEYLSLVMEQLSEDHYEILRLRYFAELTYRELADALSIPVGTVMSRLHLARKALAAITPEAKR